MKKFHVIVIEDNRLLREGIAALLDKQPDMKVASALETGETIVSVLSKTVVHVVLLDLGPELQDDLHLVRVIKKCRPEAAVVIMDFVEMYSEVLEFVQAGVSGFIVKDARVKDFVQTVRAAAEGATVLPPYLAKSLFSRIMDHAGRLRSPAAFAEAVRTTKRQRQVIHLIASGLTNKEIARQLHLSPYTVKSHVHNILEKLSLHTRVQIANHVHTADSYTAAMDTITLLGS